MPKNSPPIQGSVQHKVHLHNLPDIQFELPQFLESGNLDSLVFLLNAISDGVLVVNSSGTIGYANQSAANLLGLARKDIVSLSVHSIMSKVGDNESALDPVFGGDIIATDEYYFQTNANREIQVFLTAIPLQTETATSGAILIFRDITPSILLNLSLREREEVLSGIFGSFPSGIMLQSTDGRILRINDIALGLLGINEHEIRGMKFPPEHWNAWDSEGRPVLLDESPFQKTLTNGSQEYDRILFIKNNDVDKYVLVSSFPLDRAGGSRIVLTTFHDIDSQIRTQARMKRSIRMNHRINDLLKDLLTETGSIKTLSMALRGVCEILGADFGTLATFDATTKKLLYSSFYGMEGEKPIQFDLPDSFVLPIVRPPGQFTNDLFKGLGAKQELYSAIESENGILGAISLFRKGELFEDDARDTLRELIPVLSAALFKASYEQKLNELATRDSMTGIWNRHFFFETLAKEIERAQRYGAKLSALIMDLDLFKSINDTHGHLAGDETLRRVSEVMKRSIRSADCLARTGGEEFMVMLPDTRLEGAMKTAEKLRSAVEQLVIGFHGKELRTTISIGVAEYSREESIEDYYNRLDGHLYKAKENGRNKVVSH